MLLSFPSHQVASKMQRSCLSHLHRESSICYRLLRSLWKYSGSIRVLEISEFKHLKQGCLLNNLTAPRNWSNPSFEIVSQFHWLSGLDNECSVSLLDCCPLLCLGWSKMVTPVDLKKLLHPVFKIFAVPCWQFIRGDACEEIHLGLIFKLLLNSFSTSFKNSLVILFTFFFFT